MLWSVVGYTKWKTANMLGLISRALDAGYKNIFILAGLIEKLRQQTFERLERSYLT